MKYNLLIRNKETNEYLIGKEFSREEYLKYLLHNKDLEFFDDFDRTWRILHINLITQKNYMEKLLKGFIEPQIPMTKEDLELTKRVMNVDLFNILSGFYFYLQYCETNFTRFFGKDSDELIFLKELFSKYFDNYFEYRFFYKLRNYVVHCGLPIQMVYNPFESPTKSNLAVLFSKKHLLSAYKEWGKVKADLLNDEDDIPVFTTSINFANMIPKLNEEIIVYLKEKFQSSIEFMNTALRDYNLEEQTFSILERPVKESTENEAYEIHLNTEILFLIK